MKLGAEASEAEVRARLEQLRPPKFFSDFVAKIWLQIALAAPAAERVMFKYAKKTLFKLDGLYDVILYLCIDFSWLPNWWNADRYMGPAVLFQ